MTLLAYLITPLVLLRAGIDFLDGHLRQATHEDVAETFFVPLVARALTMPLVTRHPRVVRSLIGRRDTSRRKRCALALLHTCHPHLSSHPAHTTLLPYYLTTSLPHYLTTLLPYYLTTFVPYYCTYYCITFIPHYLTTLLPYYLTTFAFVPRCART